MKLTEESNGVYKCEYVTKSTGLHSINIFFDGHAIPNSPFGVRCKPGNLKLFRNA